MATSLSDGFIYFVESEAVGGDDWINDHAGDPDAIDLDAMTEGTEYCKLEIPRRFRIQFNTGIVVTDAGGGTSFDDRASKRGFTMLNEGVSTTRANANLITKFFMIDRHTSGLSATFKNYYLIIRFAASDYIEFIDHNNASKEYCPVRVSNGETIWDNSAPATSTIRINCRSIWEA